MHIHSLRRLAPTPWMVRLAAPPLLLTGIVALLGAPVLDARQPAAPQTAARLQVPVEYYKLPNGLKVVLSRDTTTPTVAGTAAPIRLNFLDAWGAITGSLFPTGRRIDVIDGVEVT